MEHLAKAGLNCPTPVARCPGPHAAHARGQARRARHLPRGRVDTTAATAPLRGGWARRWLRCIWPDAAFALSRVNALGVSGWRPLYQRFQARADERSRRGWPPSSSKSSTTSRPTGRPTCRRASSTPIFFPTTLLPRRPAQRGPARQPAAGPRVRRLEGRARSDSP